MRRPRSTVAVLLLAALTLLACSSVSATAPPPVLPVATFAGFLTDLSMPTLAPGQSGGVTFSVADPLNVPIAQAQLTMEVYAFNAYPGNATGPVPSGGSPVFSGAGLANGGSVSIAVGSLGRGGVPFRSPGNVSLTVTAPAGAPQGTYAVRCSLTFTSNGTSYRLESRGFFTDAQWANATAPPGEPSTLNVSRLGVSGVIPESAVLVRSNPFPVALTVVLAGSLVLAGLGGYWALRRGPGSRSGATAGPPPNHAETAFGKRRKRDGD